MTLPDDFYMKYSIYPALGTLYMYFKRPHEACKLNMVYNCTLFKDSRVERIQIESSNINVSL